MTDIKKGDQVCIIAGKDKGKQGSVISVNKEKNRVFVAGVNYVKKHEKPTKQNEKGGIVEKEASVNLSNIMLFCKRCNKGVRVAANVKKDGIKVRNCKKCNAEI